MSKTSLQLLIRRIINNSTPDNVDYRMTQLSELRALFGHPKVERIYRHGDRSNIYSQKDIKYNADEYTIPAEWSYYAHCGDVFTYFPPHTESGEIVRASSNFGEKVECEVEKCDKLYIHLKSSRVVEITLVFSDFIDFDYKTAKKETFRLTFTEQHKPNFSKRNLGNWVGSPDNPYYYIEPDYKKG